MSTKLFAIFISLALLAGPLPLTKEDAPSEGASRSLGSRAGPYTSTNATHTILGNDHFEMSFDTSLKGSIDSIMDKASGHDFRNDRTAPPLLFMVHLWNGTGHELRINWEANLTAIKTPSTSTSARVTLDYDLLGPYDIFIQFSALIRTDWDHVEMTLRVINNDVVTIEWISFPVIWGLGPIGASSADDRFLYPVGDGLLFHDPVSHKDEMNAYEMYPSSLSMQLMAYYDEDLAGLYTASLDPNGHPKELIFSGMDWGGQNHLAAQYKLYLPEEVGNDLSMEYTINVGTFHGDWRAAADIYRDWAEDQSFVSGGKVFEDKDTPDWWGSTSVIQMVNRDDPAVEIRSLDEMVDITAHFHDLTGLNTTLMIHGWGHNGAWVGPFYFPPSAGEANFKGAMSDMMANGDRGFTYLSGTVWRVTRDDIGYADHALFNSTGLPWVALNSTGEPTFDPFYETLGWHSARMDPMTDFWHDMVVNNTVDSVKLGVQVVQIDEFPIGSIYPCYNASHGHPVGYSNQLVTAYKSILSDIRAQARALDQDFILSMEEPNELYIPYMDTYVSRDNAPEFLLYGTAVDQYGDDAEFVPLFSWVYHEYITAFSEHLPLYDSYHANFYPQVARSLGRAFVSGEIQNGAAASVDELRPGLMELYNRTARATAGYGRKYLIEGRPLIEPDIGVPSKEIQWYKWYDGTFGTPFHERTVLNSAWKADDGDIGLAFVNWDNSTHTFDVQVPAYDLAPDNYTIMMTKNGAREVLVKRTELPTTVPLTMSKNDVVLLEVIQAPDLSVEASDMVIEVASPLTNELVSIDLTVHNTGTMGSGPFEVYFYSERVDGNKIVPIDTNRTVDQLGPEENITVGVTWNTTGLLGQYNITALVDVHLQVEELDETNNTVTMSATVLPRPLSNLTVRVLQNRTDAPLYNASVHVFVGKEADPFNLTGGGYTNTTGHALFPGLPSGEYHIKVDMDGYQTSHRNISLPEGTERTVTLRLDLDMPDVDHWAVLGTVYDNDTGTEIEGVNVTVFDMEQQVVVGWDLTDILGKFAVYLIPTGYYTITASKTGYYMYTEEDLYVGADVERTIVLLPVVVDPEVGDMEGYVTDNETGKPIEDVVVAVDYPQIMVQTDEDGYYILKGVPEGLYLIYVYLFPDYEMVTVNVAIVAKKTVIMNFTLQKRSMPHRLPTISGKIIDEDGDPIEGVKVERYNHVTPMENLTDAKGYFEFPEVEPGDYVFKLSAEGYVTNITKNYYVGYGDILNITVTMKRHVDPKPKFKPPSGWNLTGAALGAFITAVVAGIVALVLAVAYIIHRRRKAQLGGQGANGPDRSKDKAIVKDEDEERSTDPEE